MSAFDPADMATAEMGATKLSCRMRCFGLPLYSAIAHEASALWLGLLLVSPENMHLHLVFI